MNNKSNLKKSKPRIYKEDGYTVIIHREFSEGNDSQTKRIISALIDMCEKQNSITHKNIKGKGED